MSVNNLPAGVAFRSSMHTRKRGDLWRARGAGTAAIDGEDVKLAAGDWLRISPAAHRQFRAASDSGITYVCIQVKQGSLGAFTVDDAIMC